MSDDLVKQLRDVAEATGPNHARQIALDAADCIEALEADVKAVLRREEDANRAAMKHLRAADKLAEAVTHEREMVCQDFGMQQDAATAVHNALAAYQATKEGG